MFGEFVRKWKLGTGLIDGHGGVGVGGGGAKIIKDQMPNDQIPNYTVHTQYISIRSTS